MRKYVITEISNASSFDFSLLVDSSVERSRVSLDGSKILARFHGPTPSFLGSVTVYSNREVLEILSGSEWTPEEENI